MFMLLGGNEKKVQKETAQSDKLARVKELFGSGRFPVVTTQVFEGRAIAKVLGLVCCRSEEAPGQPAEEDDPVLQRILASQRRTAGVDWQ